MANELKIIDTDILNDDEKNDINNNLERIIAQHKNNRKEINRLVFESVAAMTEADEAQSELSGKDFLSRLIGGITGSNRKMQEKINSNRAAAQYAAQQTLQKLAEQNLMTFDLITAVNNKLNASVNAMNDEFKNIYSGLGKFLKHNRNELARIEDRLKKIEQDVSLLNWKDSIEYQEFGGEEYVDMDDAKKIVCLVRDFYEITKGNWSTSNLQTLKKAMKEIDIQPKDKVNYFDIIREIAESQTLKDKLLGGYTIKPIEDPSHLISMGALEKMDALEGKEACIVDKILDSAGQDVTAATRQEVRATLTREYLRNKANVNVDIEVDSYDLILDLLYNVKQAEDEHLLVISDTQQQRMLLDAEELFAKAKFEKAMELFLPLADAGIARAMYFMGELYSNYLPKNKRDSKLALEWRAKGAELGDVLCCLAMAHDENVSDDERKNIISKVFDQVKSLADDGDRFAQGEVGDCYSAGDGVECDIERAKQYHSMAVEQGVVYYLNAVGQDFAKCEDYASANAWYRKAGEKGDGNGWFNLGKLYDKGNGVAVDKEKAMELYQKSYEMGDDSSGKAALNLGFLYEGNKDYTAANEWYRKAGEAGNGWGWCSLALSYDQGNGVAVDKEKAMELYQKSYEMGDDSSGFSANNIGVIYKENKDYASANEWYRKAGEAGDSTGWLNLAVLYHKGYGVAVDKEKAVELYQKSYEMGGNSSGICACNLGLLYGENKDYTSANEWYRKAGEAGVGKGWYNLAINYSEGNGAAVDKKKAIELYRKSYEMDDGLSGWSAAGISTIFSELHDYENEFKWAKRSAEKNNGWGMAYLGCCYKYGRGTRVDYAEARKWLKKALEAGVEEARQELDRL